MKTSPLNIFVLLPLVLLCGFIHESEAAITAESLGAADAGYGAGGDQYQAAQTFQATLSGKVGGVTVYLADSGQPDPTFVTVTLTEVTGGVPGAVLGSATIVSPLTQVSSAAFTADFSSQSILLAQGTNYALTISTPDSIRVRGDVGDPYPDGSGFFSSDSGTNWIPWGDGDFNFQVQVLPEQRDDRLIAVDSRDGELFRLDRSSGVVSDPVLLPYNFRDPDLDAYRGMAWHPGADAYYVLVGASDGRPILATMDPNDGSFSPIAPVGVHKTPGGSPSLTFGPAPDYTLYLITGGSASTTPNSIYTIDPTTGEATPTGWTTAGLSAHAIEYNPADGFLYHFYNTVEGGGGSPGLEKIDITNGTATTIPLTGAVYGKVSGLAYLSNAFYVVGNSAKTLHTVTPTGDVTLVGSLADKFQNLASDGSSLYGLARGTGSGLREIDPADGSTLSNVALGPPPYYRRMKGLARDPVSGVLYGLTYPDYPATNNNRSVQLVQVDPLSGTFTQTLTLSVINLADLAFDDAGVLYGLAANPPSGPLDPGELEGGTIATINLSNGTVTAQPWATAKNPFLDQAIAFNSDNGLLYRVYPKPNDADLILMESIDPSSGSITPIGTVLTGQTGRSPSALTYDPTAGLFYLSLSDAFYSLTTGGTATLINVDLASLHDAHGLAIEPRLTLTSFSVDGAGATIGFTSVENREYGLYGSTNLIDWAPVAGFENIPATAPENTETNVPLPSSTKGFYRVGAPVGN